MSGSVTLRRGDWTLALRPDLGGAVTALAHGAEPVLRASAPDVSAPLDTACFLLVPYANRIAHGRFRYGGRSWQLPPNFGAHPHALHGVGWRSPWHVLERDSAAIVLEHRHDGGPAWPWAYLATQRIAIDDGGVGLSLEVESRADAPMPIGLGFHPAFPVAVDTILRADVGAVWLADADCLPTARARADHFADWRLGARIRRADLVDNCYESFRGLATLTARGRATTLRAGPGLDWLHIYIPPGRDYCCVEPVSHMPDAVNRPRGNAPTGLDELAPGETRAVAIRIEVVDRGGC
jgi:aldose 1-epimerase